MVTASGESPRWHLHRGGIVNIWQFGDRTFDLSGGRAILQGTNGSGKSRTLELLLPLCLDGDLHYLGAKGYDTVSMRRLMLDDYKDGPNRIGYAWVELCRQTSDGEQEFFTVGIGLKASTASQDLAPPWRFVTAARVGIDFQLTDRDKVPLDKQELKERLGAEALPDNQLAFQQRVAGTLYGINDVHRYDDLLHLQRTLRNPDVGVKAVEGHLEEYLSQALPPLDPDVISRLANQFQDLESIRENVSRLQVADKSLAQFLSSYAPYTTRILGLRARAVRDARRRLAAHLAETAKRSEALVQAIKRQGEASPRLAEQRRLVTSLSAQINELEQSETYTDLRSRRQHLNGLETAAATALQAGSSAREAEEGAVTNLIGWLRNLQQAVEAADSVSEDARVWFGTAELDPLLLPALPAAPATASVRTVGYAQVDLAPDSEPSAVDRLTFDEVDIDSLSASFGHASEQTKRAERAARERHTSAAALHPIAIRLQDEHKEVAELALEAEKAGTDAEQTRVEHEQATTAAEASADEWLSSVQVWMGSTPSTTDTPPELTTPPAAAELIQSDDMAATLRAAIRSSYKPILAQARSLLVAAESELEALATEQELLTTELQLREDGADLPPPSDRYLTADRSTPGCAFYQLVDFHPDLDETERAGLEAALQASGLLNAWITADGTVDDPDLQDIIALQTSTSCSVDGPYLAEYLIPTGENLPVATEVLAGLLDCVLIDAEPDAVTSDGLVLSLTGRWRAGNLFGSWSKEAAQYIGAETRTRQRLNRIAELVGRLDEIQESETSVRQRLAAAATLAESWEEHLDSFPDTAAVTAARIILATAADRYQEAERKARAAIAEHADANGRWQAKYGDFSRRATDINVPVDVAALTRRISELERAATTAAALQACLANRCRSAMGEVSRSIRQHANAVDNRVAAESEATTSHGQYSTAATMLAVHLETLGAGDAQQDRKLQELKTERDAADAAGKRLQKIYDDAGNSAIVLRAQLDLIEPTERDLRSTVAEVETSFEVARKAPGLWTAAAAQTPDVQNTMEDALAIAADWPAGTEHITLINELQILRSSLPGGFSSEAIESEGVLSIMVNDGEGSRPVTDAAARAAERLAGYREQLDTRYHTIFENYLLRDLSEHLRRQIDLAENLRARMNLILAEARSSQGVRVHLSWDPSPSLDDATREALGLVRKSFATRSTEEDASLRRALQERIETERDSRNAHYREVLAHALDYRNWYTFTVRVRDTGPDGQQRDRLLRRLSSGETRLVSYVTLFAAAAAFYEALTVPGATPLRLVLLDEAFERLDDPTITRLLELLAELDMDWVITWPSGSAFSPKIKTMQVYDILKPTGAPGIAFVHTTWDGAEVRIEG